MKLPKHVRDQFVAAGRKGGLVGGAIGSANMTPEARTARARKAVAAREAKRAEKKSSE